MTREPMDVIRDNLLDGIRSRRGRQVRRTVAVTVVVVMLAGVGAALANPWSDDGEDALVTERPDVPGVPAATSDRVWGIQQPPGWDRAGQELMPQSGWDSLTLATFPLRAGGTCPQYPGRAIADMAADDALVSVSFAGGGATDRDNWPSDGFDESSVPQTDIYPPPCTERDDIEYHWTVARQKGYSLHITVVFGDGASEQTRTRAWETLSSLTAPSTPGPAGHPVCVVTLPPAEAPPNLAEAVGDREVTPGDAWYGTPELWTVLSRDGAYGPRKSVWWSELFEGGGVEPQPDIAVTWNRLDEAGRERQADSGTNASDSGWGWFMIGGIDTAEMGCWEVTGTYRGHELSYVYWRGPNVLTLPPSTEAVGDREITADMEFDPVANCYRIELDGARHPVVWPAGTTTSPTGMTVRPPDAPEVAPGHSFDAAGALVPIEELAGEPPVAGCATDSHLVWVMAEIR